MAKGIKGSSHTRYQLGVVRTDSLPKSTPKKGKG
jgi:hypothetical protein